MLLSEAIKLGAMQGETTMYQKPSPWEPKITTKPGPSMVFGREKRNKCKFCGAPAQQITCGSKECRTKRAKERGKVREARKKRIAEREAKKALTVP